MKKRLFALLLALVMVIGLMTGCGSSEAPSGGNEGGTTSTPTQNQGAESTSTNNTPSAPSEEEETAEIVVGIMCFSPVDAAVQDRIERVVNGYMLDMINVTADFQWYDAVSYATQIPMMISAGEQLDAMMFTPIPVASFSSFMSQGQLMEIGRYIDACGPDIKSELGEAGLAATTKAGGIYGVGGILSNQGCLGITMRTDVLEAIGMKDKFDNMNSWTEFEEILKAAVAAGYPGLGNSDAEGSCMAAQPFIAGPDSFDESVWVDVVGDGNQMVYVDPADDTVKCFFAHPGYKEMMIRAGKWYDEGLIYKDAATTDEYADPLVKNGVCSGMLRISEFGMESTIAAACGYDMSIRNIESAANQLATTTFTKFGWAVPITSKEPEAAVKFINLLYSDNPVHNTLTWGEEGVDWVRRADGTASFPDGAASAEYHTNDFLFGDILTIAPWGDDPDVRNAQRASNSTLKPSKYIGFSIDNTPVANQVTACQSVSFQYKPSLNSGAFGEAQAEAKWEEYIAALEKAGINEIIAEYQSQLDAWLASK